MFIFDLIKLGLANLWKTKLRSILTIMGVVVGIGSLVSMVSFGTGMEKNVTDAFHSDDLFTSITVLSPNSPQQVFLRGSIADTGQSESVPLTDSLLEVIREIDGVEMAYPEITFPAKVILDDQESNMIVQAVPASLGKFKPYNELFAGSFFTSDSVASVVLRWETLYRMKIIVDDPENPIELSEEDIQRGYRKVSPDSLIGQPIELISATLNIQGIIKSVFSGSMDLSSTIFSESSVRFMICGILKRSSSFSTRLLQGGILIPFDKAADIPRLDFSHVTDLLNPEGEVSDYNSFYVRVDDMGSMPKVMDALKELNVETFSIADQLSEIRRGLMIMDSMLGAVGVIALLVASLGIINTMLMSILERTKEIGIMKAIGGSEPDIRKIFFVEAASIGLIGAIFGLGLGWVVTRIANYVANSQILSLGEEPIELFYFPVWLILGAIIFSILVSLGAGLYPAIRASRIDPVKALRRE